MKREEIEIHKGERGCTGWMHDATNYESARRAASQVQRGPFAHAQVSYEPPFGKEICWQLDAGTETGANHGGANATVETPDAFGRADLAEPVGGVAVAMLGAHREEGRVGLQAGFDEEEGGASCGATVQGRLELGYSPSILSKTYRMPDVAPEKMLTPNDWTLESRNIAVVAAFRRGS